MYPAGVSAWWTGSPDRLPVTNTYPARRSVSSSSVIVGTAFNWRYAFRCAEFNSFQEYSRHCVNSFNERARGAPYTPRARAVLAPALLMDYDRSDVRMFPDVPLFCFGTIPAIDGCGDLATVGKRDSRDPVTIGYQVSVDGSARHGGYFAPFGAGSGTRDHTVPPARTVNTAQQSDTPWNSLRYRFSNSPAGNRSPVVAIQICVSVQWAIALTLLPGNTPRARGIRYPPELETD